MGVIRDKVDIASAKSDMKRLAQAGGPRKIARSFGRPRGSDRFPSRTGKRGKR